MYDNIGEKVKGLSKVIAIVGIICFVIIGIIIMFSRDGFVSGLTILIFGSLACYVGSWMTYAFGTLVENSQIIADKLTAPSVVPSAPASVSTPTPSITTASSKTFWTCTECKTCNPLNNKSCSKCGKFKS